MGTIIVCNVLLILALAALAFFFGPEDNRGFAALATFQLALGFSVTGWIIFVAQHFITKYW